MNMQYDKLFAVMMNFRTRFDVAVVLFLDVEVIIYCMVF